MTQADHPLHRVFLKVLEDWALMLVDEGQLGYSAFDQDQPFFISHVDVHGAFSGTISIVAQRPFLETLTHNLLGSGDTEIYTEEEFCDAFKEMGNVLAGNFLTEAYGDDVSFDILDPRVKSISPAEFERLAHAPQSYVAMADDAPVCVTFEIGERRHDR